MARGDSYSLIKRTRNGREISTWQVRVSVPAEWRAAVGKNETLQSLGTSDRRIAARLAPTIVAGFHAKWRAIAEGKGAVAQRASRGNEGSLSTRMGLRAAVVTKGYSAMLEALEANRRVLPGDPTAYEKALKQREAEVLKLTRRLQDGDLAAWEPALDKQLASLGIPIDKDSEAYRDQLRNLAEATIDALGVFNRQQAGEFDAQPRSAVVREAKAQEAAKAKPGETILELFELWAADRLAKKEKRPDTVVQDRKRMAQFAAFVGADRSIDSITPTEVAAYRDTLRDLPPKWTIKLPGLSMRDAAAKARQFGLAQTAFTTVNQHLSTISPLYKWLAAQPRWAGLANPVVGLFHDKVKGRNPRPPFTTEQLNTILQSPLFKGFAADGREHVVGNVQADDWRKWIPLVCLFTGARIGEIAQLRIGDVRQEHEIWFVHIREDESTGLKTKSKKSRPAPVHATLEEMGFLVFHARRMKEAGGDLSAQLFPELEANERGHIGARPSRWWRKYLKAIGLKEGADGFGAHSFRHTMADRLRSEADLLDNDAAVCLGHNQPSTTAGYGRLSQGTVRKLKGWIDGVRFDGVDFGQLIPAASVG